jgi:tetratricopeptide (TPR) repeat protein
LALLIFLVFDAVRWGRYMGNHVLFEAKSLIGMTDANDLFNMGAICNTLERWKCSEKAFAALLALDPRNNVALANVAIAQTRLKKYDSAVANFERLNERAQATSDTLANYGRAFEGLGRSDDAIAWYYRSLALNPHLIDVADRLIDLLVEKKYYTEALSVIGSLAHASPQMEDLFKGRMIALSELERRIPSAPEHSIRLVSVNDHHFLPISIAGMDRPALFMVDTGATELILSRQFLAENGLEGFTVQDRQLATLADGHSVLAERIVFHSVQIGPWTLKDVTAVVCDGCAPLAGQSLLKRFQMSTRNVGGVEYLTLKR